MIEASVRGEKEGSGYGAFKFVALPSPGDRLIVGNSMGGNDILTVLYVEHTPAKTNPLSVERKDPAVSVVVRYHSEFGNMF